MVNRQLLFGKYLRSFVDVFSWRDFSPCALFGFIRNRLGPSERLDGKPALFGVELRKLRPQEENLRRIVDPGEEDQHRSRSSIGGAHSSPANIKTDCGFTRREQRC